MRGIEGSLCFLQVAKDAATSQTKIRTSLLLRMSVMDIKE